MRELSNIEVGFVAGGSEPALIAFASIFTGFVAGDLISHYPNVSTLIGTLSFGAAGAVIGTLAMPVVGTFVGGCIGLTTGYLVSSTLAPLATFGGVAAATACGLVLFV